MSAKRRQEAQDAFLLAYAETGIITSAAVAAGIDRTTVYEWQEHDEAFSLRFHEAEAIANDAIRAEIHRRAVAGWEEPVYQLGKYAGTVRKYSDTLLIFEAKRRMPEYRDKVDVKATVQAGLMNDGTDDSPEAAALARGFLLGLGSIATRRIPDADGAGDPGE